jgi:hypothetical protein
MYNKLYICFFLLVLSTGTFSQQPARHLRIVDTLTAQEKTNRNPVLLKSEYDSLIAAYNASLPPQVIKEPVKEETDYTNRYILLGLVAIILLLVLVIYMFSRHQNKINRTIAGLKEEKKSNETTSAAVLSGAGKEKKSKPTLQSLEVKINDLNNELNKLLQENESLNDMVKEYNGIQKEFDSLKHGILKAYKVKNYPGYNKEKDEVQAMQGVLETENFVAAYAYEKFLKPILAITDANKNSPAKINEEDKAKLMDSLISLSLLYIEYLYLRVNELSIGGKMVERIQALGKGKGVDTSLLKKLSTEFGSRALVIRMVLSKAMLDRLSYPVFDETNLNNQ